MEKIVWGGVSLLNKENKKSVFKVVIGVLLLFVVGGIIFLSNSYALFKKEITGRNVELKVGELTYNLESEKLENNQITLKPNSSEIFEVNLTSMNEIDSKYELYYKIISPEALENTVDGGYLETSTNPSSGTIESTNSKTIQLVFNNTGSQEVIIEVGVRASLLPNEVTLEEGEITLKEIDFQKHYVFDYTGDYQTFTVPVTGTYKIDLWGAGMNGLGGYTSGTIELEKEEKLYVYIGGTSSNPSTGGYNGGGKSGRYENVSGNSGAGATDIRLVSGTWNNATSLRSRIMVAAGGCGGIAGTGGTGIGHAGGLIGYSTVPASPYQTSKGGNGSQTAGGTSGVAIGSGTATSYRGTSGGFGYAGNGGRGVYSGYAGGGGGGYYGGSGGVGGYQGGWGGGGGSSFISGHAGCIAIKSETDQTSKVTTYSKIEDSYHYSEKIFTNTIMIDGMGYKWTTKKETKIDMPTHDLTSTMTGNTGNGYARITYIGE